MASKNRVEVTIQGKTFTLTGTESEQYITKVAEYIDEKVSALRKSSPQIALDSSLPYVLTSVNVADDYFKELEKSIVLEENVNQLKLELSGKKPKAEFDKLNHELEKLKKELSTLKQENEMLRNDIIVLETEKEQLQYEVEQLRINKSNENKMIEMQSTQTQNTQTKAVAPVTPQYNNHLGAHKSKRGKTR